LPSPSSCSTILFWITSIVADLFIGYGVNKGVAMEIQNYWYDNLGTAYFKK